MGRVERYKLFSCFETDIVDYTSVSSQQHTISSIGLELSTDPNFAIVKGARGYN